jgi:hypothetical protein
VLVPDAMIYSRDDPGSASTQADSNHHGGRPFQDPSSVNERLANAGCWAFGGSAGSIRLRHSFRPPEVSSTHQGRLRHRLIIGCNLSPRFGQLVAPSW